MKQTSKPASNKSITSILLPVTLGIWSVVGLVLLILISVAIFRSGTWVENLNIASEPEVAEQAPAQQPQQQPQQPPQPTQEQLSCISDDVGEDRLAELEQGQPATEEESATIQRCLQG